MQELLSEPDGDLNSNSIFAGRVKGYAIEIEPYDETLAAALLSLNGALVLSSDFHTASAEKNVRDVLQTALNQSKSNTQAPDKVVNQTGFLHRISFWKKVQPVRESSEANGG